MVRKINKQKLFTLNSIDDVFETGNIAYVVDGKVIVLDVIKTQTKKPNDVPLEVIKKRKRRYR